MKQCPKCGSPHEKPGTFCSRSCANARDHSPEVRAKIAAGTSEARKQNAGKPMSPAQLEAVKRASATSRERFQERISLLPFEERPWRVIRNSVIDEQNGKCLWCANNTWLGKPIKFEIDHKDGNRKNNLRSNLRALCPNCHSCTPTWRKGWKLVRQAGIEPASQE